MGTASTTVLWHVKQTSVPLARANWHQAPTALIPVIVTLLAVRSGQVVAFKALLAADPIMAKALRDTTAKGLASGSYTFWWESLGGIGTSTTPVNTTSLKACLSACDNVEECAAVAMTGVTAVTAPISTCHLVKGDSTLATFKRSVTRVVTSRLTLASPTTQAPSAGETVQGMFLALVWHLPGAVVCCGTCHYAKP